MSFCTYLISRKNNYYKERLTLFTYNQLRARTLEVSPLFLDQKQKFCYYRLQKPIEVVRSILRIGLGSIARLRLCSPYIATFFLILSNLLKTTTVNSCKFIKFDLCRWWSHLRFTSIWYIADRCHWIDLCKQWDNFDDTTSMLWFVRQQFNDP